MPTTDDTQDREWVNISPQARPEALECVEFYLDDFIGIVQGGQEERTQMTIHLFHTVNSLFRLNNTNDKDCLNPISIKKLKKVKARWSTTETVLGWSIDTAKQVLTLPQAIKYKLNKALVSITKYSHSCSKKKWQCLLVLLRSAVPEIYGAHGMFSQIQHAL